MFGSKHILAPNNLVDVHHTPILKHLQLSLQQETVTKCDALEVGVLVLRSLLQYPIWHSKRPIVHQKQEVKHQWKTYMSGILGHQRLAERTHASTHRRCQSEWQWRVDLNLLSQYGQNNRIARPSQGFSQTHSPIPSSCNEIVKQLVWNSLMKGLMLKVKLIYVMLAWSQSCSVIFRECGLRLTTEWSPQLRSYWRDRKKMKTAASSSVRQSARSA